MSKKQLHIIITVLIIILSVAIYLIWYGFTEKEQTGFSSNSLVLTNPSLSIEFQTPREISIKKLDLNTFSFSNRLYKIREVPEELIGLNRLYFPGGGEERYELLANKPVRIYAVFNYNPNWHFPNDSSPEEYGWLVYEEQAYKGDSNSGRADVYFKDFLDAEIILNVPRWWLCLGIQELDVNNLGFHGEPIRIISHAGYIEPAYNTIESIERAIQLGAYGVEIDIQFTKDAIPILLHDVNMSREIGVDLNCTELELNQIKQYKIGGLYDIPTLNEVIEFVQDKIKLLIVDTIHLPADCDFETYYEIIQDTISECDAESFVIIQLKIKDNLRYINLDTYKVSWNTLPVQDDYRIPFYTLNPLSLHGIRFINSEKVQEIHEINSEVISVCLSEDYYLLTIQNGSKYIMVWDIERFKEFCKKYDIPIYGEK